MTTSGRAATTAFRKADESKTSTTAALAPWALRCPAFSADRVDPVTSWPAATSIGTKRRPIAPVAPARKIFTRFPSLRSFQPLQRLDDLGFAGQRLFALFFFFL